MRYDHIIYADKNIELGTILTEKNSRSISELFSFKNQTGIDSNHHSSL